VNGSIAGIRWTKSQIKERLGKTATHTRTFLNPAKLFTIWSFVRLKLRASLEASLLSHLYRVTPLLPLPPITAMRAHISLTPDYPVSQNGRGIFMDSSNMKSQCRSADNPLPVDTAL
jgi:hypothetical protein